MGLHRHTIKGVVGVLVCASFLAVPGWARASTTDGTIDVINKYAWSENIGWVNFGTLQGAVHVTDTQLTGYAWNENTGWINLAPSGTTYVHNDSNGTLSGYAWGEGSGYIDFTGVTIDSSGYFHGYASSTISGRISFNCLNISSCGLSDFKVQTDWRPANSRTTTVSVPTPVGGGNGPPAGLSLPPKFGQTVIPTMSALDTPKGPSDEARAGSPIPPDAQSCTPYLRHFIRSGRSNDSREVRKLQEFLQTYENASRLSVTGIYDSSTRVAVLEFQTKYATDILGPWSTSAPTGYVFRTTLKKINQIYCANQSSHTTFATSTLVSAPVSSVACPYFTKRLIFNSQSAEVPSIQALLKSQGLLEARYPTGMTLDRETVEAVKAFQTKYASDILGPDSLSAPSGFWLSASIKKANLLMGCK